MAEIRIITNRDPKTGEFFAAEDYWKQDKVEELLKKYNPKGTFHYHKDTEDDD